MGGLWAGRHNPTYPTLFLKLHRSAKFKARVLVAQSAYNPTFRLQPTYSGSLLKLHYSAELEVEGLVAQSE